VTARWVVEQVAPRRDLNVIWQPISLLFKNEPEEGSSYFEGTMIGHRMLRVMESLRADHGEEAAANWYWLCGTTLHHDKRRDADLGDLLEHLGHERTHAAAADDDRWDIEIRSRMDAGLALVGDDVGTPIIAFECPDGTKRGIFGPVITRVPGTEQSLKLWDAMETFTTMDGFWEIKRTRTEGPEFGDRPEI
jgi:Mycothiol-dependent nitroreductase Rv2466c